MRIFLLLQLAPLIQRLLFFFFLARIHDTTVIPKRWHQWLVIPNAKPFFCFFVYRLHELLRKLGEARHGKIMFLLHEW